MYETTKKEKALLVLVSFERHGDWPIDEQVEEFKNLVVSAGIEVERVEIVKRKEIIPSFYIGKGKVYELAEIVSQQDINVVIFNHNLNFSQQRNLEDIICAKTIDRTQLILDIFARHAHTQEGTLQVELAQLEYLLPRLRGKGIMLSRLGGGIGTRGPGEKKLEVDRRHIADRIVKLKKDLKNVHKHRGIQRKKRCKEMISVCSLVGYTNAGKSTLLNKIAGTNQKTSDSLFTTLDPLSRTFLLSNSLKVILSDTVGFIYKLPPHLIESFKATLEELYYGDILIHVVDASSKNYKRLISAVDSILAELKLEEKELVLVLNKIDKIESHIVENLRSFYPDAVFVSALNGTNLELLLDKIKDILSRDIRQLVLRFPIAKMKIMDYLYTNSEVLKVEYSPQEVIVWTKIKNTHLPYLKRECVIIKEI